MPFCVTRRLDNWRNCRGTQESAAMFDNTAASAAAANALRFRELLGELLHGPAPT